jgi:O-antigen chain-terminating methyltransferase
MRRLEKQLESTSKTMHSILFTQRDLQHQVNMLRPQKSTSSDGPSAASNLFADDHSMDKFYIEFEDRFRGSEALISERLAVYLPYFKKAGIDFAKTPVLDIGSGRGELLQLLKKHRIRAVGLDINHDMVERSKKKDLEAVQGDALAYLRTAKAKSFGAITGFHLVEHIPFGVLLRMFQLSYRALADGGLVIFETPNPENVLVGSYTFYMDPSHLHPLPPALLAFALESCGFTTEILRLHPDTDVKTDDLPPLVAERMFGPRDYAVIGRK